ncbi:arsenate reductase (glutaredoxin) [Moheibacter lacus]|uniref:Arsenate reductase (Glutaredoxin) n=1 Tax=Moheibacter lacus TaxID=2745851 RepID=A0A838ZTK3_9FLAO|nr:arsenate reductase (glutaredoxin) [Moheibacter lacus]MBA5630318.1 arsenate reductase (glutaredoxin) [Moheibacter lacus]
MIKIYHNNRCSKSREGKQIIEDSGKDFEVVEYMKAPMSKNDLESIIQKLRIRPLDLVRKKEKAWKENFEGQDLTDDEIIQAMIEHPALMERPIVINGRKAVVGRPPVLIKDIL